jgi:hypothetical protein
LQNLTMYHMVSSDNFSSNYCFSKNISCWMAIRKRTPITVSGRFVEWISLDVSL